MAYIITWDASTPDGAITPAADIDQEIQDLKAALGERLVQIMPEWANDGEDPKKISIVVDDIANRPATPDFQGEMFFAQDIATMYVANSTPEWVATGGIVEEGSEAPSTTLAFSAYKTGDQNITHGAGVTALSGWSVIFQAGTWYSAGNPTRITAPAAGDYFLSGEISCVIIGTARAGLSSAPGLMMSGHNVGEETCTISFSRVVTFSVGQYLEVVAESLTSIIGAVQVKGAGYTTISAFRLA